MSEGGWVGKFETMSFNHDFWEDIMYISNVNNMQPFSKLKTSYATTNYHRSITVMQSCLRRQDIVSIFKTRQVAALIRNKISIVGKPDNLTFEAFCSAHF